MYWATSAGSASAKDSRVGKALEQGGVTFVDPLIRTLGGQPDGEEKLVVLVILQGAQRVGIELLQRLDDGNDILFLFHFVNLAV